MVFIIHILKGHKTQKSEPYEPYRFCRGQAKLDQIKVCFDFLSQNYLKNKILVYFNIYIVYQILTYISKKVPRGRLFLNINWLITKQLRKKTEQSIFLDFSLRNYLKFFIKTKLDFRNQLGNQVFFITFSLYC